LLKTTLIAQSGEGFCAQNEMKFGGAMKRLLIAVALLGMTSVASAVDLYISNPIATVSPSTANGGFNPDYNPGLAGTQGIPGFSVISGTTFGTIGTLMIDGPGYVTFTFLGKEAGFNNFFFDAGGVPVDTILDTGPSVGLTSTQTYLAAGQLNFSFGTLTNPPGGGVANGSALNTSPTFAIFAGQSSGYKYILGYDDVGAGPDRDFDDMVIGVNVTPVPEPEIYAMMAAGLGLMGFVARRRQRNGAVV